MKAQSHSNKRYISHTDKSYALFPNTTAASANLRAQK
jgi:hypothetical protein